MATLREDSHHHRQLRAAIVEVDGEMKTIMIPSNEDTDGSSSDSGDDGDSGPGEKLGEGTDSLDGWRQKKCRRRSPTTPKEEGRRDGMVLHAAPSLPTRSVLTNAKVDNHQAYIKHLCSGRYLRAKGSNLDISPLQDSVNFVFHTFEYFGMENAPPEIGDHVVAAFRPALGSLCASKKKYIAVTSVKYTDRTSYEPMLKKFNSKTIVTTEGGDGGKMKVRTKSFPCFFYFKSATGAGAPEDAMELQSTIKPDRFLCYNNYELNKLTFKPKNTPGIPPRDFWFQPEYC